MSSTVIKWVASIGFGLVIGRAAFSIVNPLMQAVFGLDAPATQPYAPVDQAVVDRMLMATGGLCLMIAIAVAAALLRVGDNRRLAAWGCAILGVVLLLTLPMALVSMEPTPQDPASARDVKTAMFFWWMIFGLPYLAAGLALTIGGAVMLRKFRKAA